MKRITYSCFYKVLSFLSNYFDNRYLKKYKVLLGTTLLVLTSACQNPKKDNPEEILCYEVPAEYEDTVQIQSTNSSEIVHNTSAETPYDSNELIVSCYDVLIGDPEPEVICYEPAPDFYVAVEWMPEFPGGDKALMSYIQEKMVYPKDALKDSIQGRVVVSFIIEKDGSLSSIEVVRGITASLDKEAIRIIRSMPKWKPGEQRDKVVRVEYTLPIRFKLPEINTEK
ncbi:MAG: energy transducer TonB [Tannerella sp.]|jgi:TonB family protein|nr:energy transducer TonB [Tannerella sp.]